MYTFLTSCLCRIITQILSLQKEMNLPKGRPFLVLSLPTFGHQIPDLPGALVRRLEDVGRHGSLASAVQGGQVGDDLLVTQGFVRLLAGEGQDFPQGHAERPHVAFGGEFALKKEYIYTVHTVMYHMTSILSISITQQ